MKAICHLWSRGRHFSPSLPGDRYLKLISQKRSPGRNLGEHRSVRRSGTASRSTALLVLSLRMRSFPTTEFDSICVGKSIRLFSIKYTAFTRPRLLNIWIRLSVCWLALFFAMFAVLKILQLTSYQIVRKMKNRTTKCPSISPPILKISIHAPVKSVRKSTSNWFTLSYDDMMIMRNLRPKCEWGLDGCNIIGC